MAPTLRTKAPSVELLLSGPPLVTFNFASFCFGRDSIAAALICEAAQHLRRSEEISRSTKKPDD